MAGKKKNSAAGSVERAPWSVVVKAVFKDAFVLDPSCRGAARDVGLRLMHYFDMDGMWRAYPSIETLAKDLTLSEEGVRKATHKLEAAGWFVVDRSKGGRADGYGGFAPYLSNTYIPQWHKIGEFMPERWRQLEKLARDKGLGSEDIEQDPPPNWGTGINTDLSPNQGWGMAAIDPPTAVGRNPQPALDGTPNGRTPNLLNRTPKEKLPEAASRSSTGSFFKNRVQQSACRGDDRDDEAFDPDDPDLIPWRHRERWHPDRDRSDE